MMKILPFFPCLCALLAPAPLAAQTGTPPVIRPGHVAIALDPEQLSYLPLDSGALRQNLCRGNVQFPVDEWGTISPREECNLSVAPPPGIDLYLGNATSTGSSWRISVQPTGSSSWPASSPVETACGSWDVAMELDPDPTAQPVSQLALETSGPDPAQGLFAGVVKLAVRYRFVNHAKGISREVPAVVPLELSGRWVAVPAGQPGLGAGDSNVLLFAGFFDEEWLSFPAEGGWGGNRHCPVHVIPGAGVLEGLNQTLH